MNFFDRTLITITANVLISTNPGIVAKKNYVLRSGAMTLGACIYHGIGINSRNREVVVNLGI